MEHLVVFAVGKDRPGIVAGVSKVLYELNCNIEDSTMAILKNQFAMILIVTPPIDLTREKIKEKLKEVAGSLSLKITVNEVADEELTDTWENAKRHILTVFGADKVGIVYKVSQTLADRGINIADVKTKVMRGKNGNVYAMVLEVDIPPEVNMKELKGALKEVSRQLEVDLNLREIPTAKM